MNIIDSLIINVVFIMFPLVAYLLFFCFNKSFGRTGSFVYLDIALYASLYLSMKYGLYYVGDIPLTLFNIPLLVAYIKERRVSAIFMSLAIVIYYSVVIHYNPILIILEYVFYYLIYVGVTKDRLTKEKAINIFVLIKAFSLSCQTFMFSNSGLIHYLEILVTVVLFYVICYGILRLLNKSEEIVDLNVTIKELEHEKQIKTSLFKITHEIKNPIAVCKGYLDMFDVDNPQHAIKYVPIMKQEIETTLNIMEDFLDFSKINIQFDILDINMFLDDVCLSFENLIIGKDIDYQFHISDDEDYVLGDYNRLKQVLINIIKNSLEAVTDDGKIVIDTRKDENNFKIIVNDNGIGMDSKQFSQFDEMFFTTKQHGTGLGVSLSKEIIKRHKGSVDYESEEGVGTTVVITLPLYKEK